MDHDFEDDIAVPIPFSRINSFIFLFNAQGQLLHSTKCSYPSKYYNYTLYYKPYKNYKISICPVVVGIANTN